MNNPPNPDNLGAPLPPVPNTPRDNPLYAQVAENETGTPPVVAPTPDRPSTDYSDLLRPLPGLPRGAQDNPRFRTAAPATAENAGRPSPVVNAEGAPRQPDARMSVEGRLHTPVASPSATLNAIEARINQRAAERAAAQAAATTGTPETRPANAGEPDPSLYWRPYITTRRTVSPWRDAEGNVHFEEVRNHPIFPTTPGNPNAASSAEAQRNQETQETEKTRWQKLKGVIGAITRPYTWTGKSRGMYAAGFAIGSAASIFGITGAGPIPRLGLTLGTYAASFGLEKYSRWRLKKSLTPEERLRFEEKYKQARYKLSGFSAGLAASSLTTLAASALSPDLVQAIGDAGRQIGGASARAGGRFALRGAIGALGAAQDAAEFSANVADRLGDAHDAVVGGIEQFGDKAAGAIDQFGTGAGPSLSGVAAEIADHSVAGSQGFPAELGHNAMEAWQELVDTHQNGGLFRSFLSHIAGSGAQNSAEAYAAAQEFAAQTGGEAGSVLGDFIEKYFNVNEVVVQQGQPLEHILNNLNVTGHAYNNTEWMTEFVSRNYEALKVGNEIGLNNFDKFVLANPDAPAEEVRKQFFRAVHWIYPGQTLEIPLP